MKDMKRKTPRATNLCAICCAIPSSGGGLRLQPSHTHAQCVSSFRFGSLVVAFGALSRERCCFECLAVPFESLWRFFSCGDIALREEIVVQFGRIVLGILPSCGALWEGVPVDTLCNGLRNCLQSRIL